MLERMFQLCRFLAQVPHAPNGLTSGLCPLMSPALTLAASTVWLIIPCCGMKFAFFEDWPGHLPPWMVLQMLINVGGSFAFC